MVAGLVCWLFSVCFGFGGFAVFRLFGAFGWFVFIVDTVVLGFCGWLVRVVCFEFLVAFGFMSLVVWRGLLV